MEGDSSVYQVKAACSNAGRDHEEAEQIRGHRDTGVTVPRVCHSQGSRSITASVMVRIRIGPSLTLTLAVADVELWELAKP